MPTTMCQKFVYSTSQEIILIFSENSTSHRNMISKADIWHHPIYCGLFFKEYCKTKVVPTKLSLNITLRHTQRMLNQKTLIFSYFCQKLCSLSLAFPQCPEVYIMLRGNLVDITSDMTFLNCCPSEFWTGFKGLEKNVFGNW